MTAHKNAESDLTNRLRIKADMISLGERIAWGSDTGLMIEAAARIGELEAQLAESADERSLRLLGHIARLEGSLIEAQSEMRSHKEALAEHNRAYLRKAGRE